MIYTIKLSNYTSTYQRLAIAKYKHNALLRICRFPINTTEKLLDKYLQDNYQITLKYACYLIILNSTIEEQKDELVISLPPNKKLDKIARLITYGTGKLMGSRILPFALTKL